MVYLTDLFSSHMGHGSAYPLTVLISRFAFRGVVSNDISVFPRWTFAAEIYSYLSFTFFFYLYTA